jgi:hypothetical protein
MSGLLPLLMTPAGADRSFVTFILEPLYKLTSAVVGEHPKTIERLLGDEFGIHLKSSAYSQDVKPLLKEVSEECEALGTLGFVVGLCACAVHDMCAYTQLRVYSQDVKRLLKCVRGKPQGVIQHLHGSGAIFVQVHSRACSSC